MECGQDVLMCRACEVLEQYRRDTVPKPTTLAEHEGLPYRVQELAVDFAALPRIVGTKISGYDLDTVLAAGPDALMMLRVQKERMSGGYFPTAREYTVGYGLTKNRLATLKPDVPILHPGPMNRGLEIAADAADAVQSAVLDQVSAGVAVRMAVLYHLLAGEEVAS